MFKIREIEAKDNSRIEKIIRDCLIEYGGNHEGTAWADPNLGRFSEIYRDELNKYWVAENEEGVVIAGVGIGKLDGVDGICELQKMYCIKEARGTGVAKQLINIALDYAKKYYKKCYLETLDNMIEAQKFYEKNVKTDHFACEVKYIKEL